MAGEGRQGKVVLIMGKEEELKKYERKDKKGRKRKGEVMNKRDKVEDKKVKMSSGSTSGTAEVEKQEEKKVRRTRGSTATAAKESPRKWPVRERKEKEREKLKVKVDKCIKECLFDFCELLDIPVTKESKKVELSAKLLEFLESPHATTDVLLARKRQSKRGNKRTRRVNMIHASSPEELVEIEGSLEERTTTEDVVSEYEEHKTESKEQVNFLPEEDCIEVKQELVEKEQDTASKEGKATIIKKNPASKTITERQPTGENKAHAEAYAGPSREEMWDMVTGLLKEVDFDVVTFSDILKRLETNFNTSLSNRKPEIRRLIKEAITSMTGDEELEDVKGGNRVG
ncbi:protein DEK [Cinnamomum micranthum f. kanehirae]|uniref:Protein DEK n=1 Tax=Cinnamomum micranthum f. kanehirae TaxID=337451 RepID=A0A3S3PX02_9MAGN|nr:protein DEK [Cinnamomum micranthum f. kanehirae]